MPEAASGNAPLHRRQTSARVTSSAAHGWRGTLLLDIAGARPLRMADLAREAGCSTRQLSRAFRQRMGVLPYQYVLQQRVESARALIEQGGVSLAHVAAAVGFADQSQMTKTFRRLLGTTPGRLRRQAAHEGVARAERMKEG